MSNKYLEKIAQLYDETGAPVTLRTPATESAASFVAGAGAGAGIATGSVLAAGRARKVELRSKVTAQQTIARNNAKKSFSIATNLKTPEGAIHSPNKVNAYKTGVNSMDRAITLSNRLAKIRSSSPLLGRGVAGKVGKGAMVGALAGGAVHGAYKSTSGRDL